MASEPASKDAPHEAAKDLASSASGETFTAEGQQTYTGMATGAASTAATTAVDAAVGVKDSVFSMFGGGAKKETKEDEDEGEQDRSGSAKAAKDAAAKEKEDGEDGEAVSSDFSFSFPQHV